MSAPVQTRLVFHIAGYDPMSARTAHHRFARELDRIRPVWNVGAEAGPLAVGEHVASWPVRMSGPDWTTETEVRWLRWDDVMAGHARVSAPLRLWRGLGALLDFARGGAPRRYLRHNWRYALFFAYPALLLLGMVAAGCLAGWAAGSLTGLAWIGFGVGLALAFVFLVWARRGMRLDHLLDDWIFAAELIRHPDTILTARMDRLAEDILSAAARREADEILVLGHSLGAVLAVDILDRALARDPALGAGATISLATVGSSVPKIGFHDAATRLREQLGRVGASEALCWVDYTAHADVMNFHKLHPVRGLGAGRRGPLVRFLSIRNVLAKAYYRTIRANLLRVHNQFVSGNDVRAAYDYFILTCGPHPLAVLAGAENGAADGLGPDGTLVAAPAQLYRPPPGLDRLP